MLLLLRGLCTASLTGGKYCRQIILSSSYKLAQPSSVQHFGHNRTQFFKGGQSKLVVRNIPNQRKFYKFENWDLRNDEL